MTREEAYAKCEAYIAAFDEIIADVKSIRNYRYSSLCTDFLSGTLSQRDKAWQLLTYVHQHASDYDATYAERELETIAARIENAQKRVGVHQDARPFQKSVRELRKRNACKSVFFRVFASFCALTI